MTPLNLHDATASQIDAALAELQADAGGAQSRLDNAHQALLRILYPTEARASRHNRQRTLADLVEDAHARLTNDVSAHEARATRSVLATIDRAQAALTEIRTKAAPLNTEFDRRGGWTRAFLVRGTADAHVHKSTQCSTCNRGARRTQFTWLTDYSGMSTAEIITAAGWRACTTCWPSAPTGTPSTLPSSVLPEQDRSRRAQRESTRAAAALARIEKAPTLDGSPLRIRARNGATETFKTERSATQWVVGCLANEQLYGYDVTTADREGIDTVIAALAAKHSTTTEAIRSAIDTKVVSKVKRDSR